MGRWNFNVEGTTSRYISSNCDIPPQGFGAGGGEGETGTSIMEQLADTYLLMMIQV